MFASLLAAQRRLLQASRQLAHAQPLACDLHIVVSKQTPLTAIAAAGAAAASKAPASAAALSTAAREAPLIRSGAAAVSAASKAPVLQRHALVRSLQQQLQQHRGYAQGVDGVAAAVLAKARAMSLPVGVAAGVFGSLVGVGGGILIVPAIVNACRTIPQRVVSGTSLAAVVATAAASARTYAGEGLVDVRSAAVIAGAAVLTAPLGARLTTRLDCGALRRALGYFLLCAAPLVPFKAYVVAADLDAAGSRGVARLADLVGVPAEGATAALMAATGAVAGTASGLLGIGGGVIVTPLLAVLTDMPQAAVLGTSLLCMLPPSLVGLAQHARLGNVDLRMAAALACGSLVGGTLGSHLAVSAPSGLLEGVFAVGMLFLGRKTLALVAKK